MNARMHELERYEYGTSSCKNESQEKRKKRRKKERKEKKKKKSDYQFEARVSHRLY